MEKEVKSSQRVTITGEGRIPLSRRLRAKAGFYTGDQVLMTPLDHGGVLVETPTQRLRRIQEKIGENWQGTTDVVGELADDRRAEANRDIEDEGGVA